MNTPTLQQLQRGLQIAEHIAALEAEMASIFSGSAPASAAVATPTVKTTRRKKGTMSTAGRARIAAAQKARWAAFKKGKAPAATKALGRKKSKMSASHRAKLAKAAQARWARIKAGKEPSPFGR